ncbi:hypothetical protein STCU_04572 [Strigomonas culicis]|uniref:Uncharacterized protein n=1 Tax=Strigomonas culicis TaxID=28005 RepID=S9VQL0_9TRYP|nr:hypothetical protein STCU_04572 [Strigomonas culicis]|eukprot:EPY29406.1 hypothetical protein STCU_04572 [Strigomonas culicis]
MDRSAELLKVRHRYNALVHERHSLLSSSESDSHVTEEMKDLESRFPELVSKKIATAPSLHSFEAQHDPVNKKKEQSAPVNSREASTEEQTNSSGEESRLSAENAGLFFFLGIYNILNRRSSLGINNFLKIVIMSFVVAGVHRFWQEPCSIIGASVTPQLFCYMINISNFYSIFIHRRYKLFIYLFSVYAVFDFLPSLLVSVFSYSLANTIFSLFGAPSVDYYCAAEG